MNALNSLIWYYRYHPGAKDMTMVNFLRSVPYGPARLLKHYTQREVTIRLTRAAGDLASARGFYVNISGSLPRGA